MDRFTEMEVFVGVVETAGFTDAGRKLGLSKSAVSKHISALEARLGARLLNRTTRRVSATEIGLAYYEKARITLRAAQDADSLATAMQGTPTGELKISAPISFGLRYVAPALASFLTDYKDVSARLKFDDQFVDLVAEGYDLAIRIGDLPDSSLLARKLAQTDMHICASPAYLKKHGEPKTLEDLAQHELLHYSLLSSGPSWRLRAPDGEDRIIRADGRLSVNNGDALAQAARDGLGILLSPNFICGEDLTSGALVEVLPQYRPAPLGIYAIYPAGKYTQPKLRVFVDHLAESLRGKGPRW
ncbi:MAG: LysR family transcriptional regulator [Pikeienuella sp.]